MKKLKYICEGEPLFLSNFPYVVIKDYDFTHRNGKLCVNEGGGIYGLDIFEIRKKVLTNNKLNRKLYEGKYVIREGYLTLDME